MSARQWEGGQAPTPTDALVHGRLAHWARCHPHGHALTVGDTSLSFADLHARVQARQDRLQDAPDTVLLEADAPALDRVITFLAVIASGRCAAVSDPDWPTSVHAHIAGLIHADTPGARGVFVRDGAHRPAADGASPFYIGFTSGSTGVPKGFKRDHRSWTESFQVAVTDFGEAAAGPVLAPGSLSHSLFLFGALMGLWTGAGVVLQERFSAADALASLQAGHASVLVAVPSQLAMMLAWAERKHLAPIMGVELIMISGARWMRERTPALRARFPRARIVEFYGASETSFIAWRDADEHAPAQAVGRPFSNVALHIGADPTQAPMPPGTPGLIWVKSPMQFLDYVGDTDGTAALRVGPWLSVRDMGYVDDAGELHLCGRENRMVVTQGKNLFPEEVEAHLLNCPGIAHASVHGLPDPTRGQRVHAVLDWDDAHGEPPTGLNLTKGCHAELEQYKAPRHWWRWCGTWPQTTGGKTDHAAIARALHDAVGQASQTVTPLIVAWETR